MLHTTLCLAVQGMSVAQKQGSHPNQRHFGHLRLSGSCSKRWLAYGGSGSLVVKHLKLGTLRHRQLTPSPLHESAHATFALSLSSISRVAAEITDRLAEAQGTNHGALRFITCRPKRSGRDSRALARLAERLVVVVGSQTGEPQIYCAPSIYVRNMINRSSARGSCTYACMN
jgi:hypothetical protein